MPRLNVTDDQDPIDSAVDAAIENSNDDFGFGGNLDDPITDDMVNDDATTQTQSSQNTNAAEYSANAQPPQPSTDAGQQPASNEGTQQQSTSQTPSQTDNQQQADGQRQFGQQVRDDGQGNFVDAQTGQLVARRGAERRMYEKARKMETTLVNTQQELARIQQHTQRLAHELQTRQQQQPEEPAVVKTARERNLSDQDMQLGLDIVSQIKTNPVQGVQWVLQTAMQQGYTIEQLLGQTPDGQSNVGSLQMGAVKQMIDQAVQPLTQRQQHEQQEAQQREEVQRKYETFVNSHPFSNVHMDAIVDLVQNNPNLTPESAYYEIKLFAQQNGLDFSQPLAPQVQAMQQQQQVPMQPQQPVTAQPPIPGGGVNPNLYAQTPRHANANDDWDSIINESMREANMQF